MQEEEIKEILKDLKNLEDKIIKNYRSLILPQNEIYKQIIEVSKKYPEFQELIEFIIFLSDTQNTNNEFMKESFRENFQELLKLKIKTLNTILTLNGIYKKKLLKNEEEIKLKKELKKSVDEMPFGKRIIFYLFVTLPENILSIISNLVSSKIGVIAIALIIAISAVHFMPKEAKYLIDKFAPVAKTNVKKTVQKTMQKTMQKTVKKP